MKGGVWIMSAILGNTPLVYSYMKIFWRTIDKQGEREGTDDDEERENNVAEDNRGDRDRDSKDADSPEPVGAPLLVFVFMRIPLNTKLRPWHNRLLFYHK